MKITDEPFEVGMLHPKIVHDLERPSTRIAGWGSTAVNKSERNAMKKIAAEEREAIRTAIRLDVDDELAEWVYSRALVDDARCNEHIILKALKEFNLPFPKFWVEFPDNPAFEAPFAPLTPEARTTVKGSVVGCLVEEIKRYDREKGVMGDGFSFQFYDTMAGNSGYGIDIYRPGVTSRWANTLDKELQRGTRPAVHIKDEEIMRVSEVGTVAFGLFGPNDGPMDTNGMDHDSPVWQMFRGVDIIEKRMYWCEHIDLNGHDFTIGTFDGVVSSMRCQGMWLRFVIMAINTLNYPWVAREKVMGVANQKSSTPRIVPRNDYYRLKIKLPKDFVEEVQPSKPRQRPYGTALHRVRGHPREYKNPDGSIRKTIWIDSFERGDEKYGVIVKDYQLVKDLDKDDDK